MEVVSREDKITHAIIGGGEQINFGITDDAMFMHMLSSTLYSDKILAVARETLCNAWDAHIEAGVTDRAVEITVTNDKLVIKDYGFGIPRSKIGEVYGTYGKSTKKHDGKQTGGFGLGCKSPFAYTDHFEVTSCNEGQKTIYKMTKSSAELEGKPGIVPILTVPTDETGITVTIDLQSATDAHRFEKLLKRLIANGEIFACVNGQTIDVIPFSSAKNGYAITKQEVLENRRGICVRYGNVIYPLDSHEQYRDLYAAAEAVLSKLAGAYRHHTNEQYNLILSAPANEVAITPSREALSMEAKTIKTVTEVLTRFLRMHNERFEIECLTLVKKKVDELLEGGKISALLRRPHMNNVMASTMFQGKRQFVITDAQAAARVLMSQEYPSNGRFEFKDIQHRLTRMIQTKSDKVDIGLIRRFRREYLRAYGKTGVGNPRKWFIKNIIAPVATKLKATDGMDTSRLMIVGNHEMLKGWGGTIEAYPLDGFHCDDLMGYLPFTRQIVVLTHSKANIGDRMRRYTVENEDGSHTGFGNLYGESAGVLAYVVPRTPKKVAAARAFFAEHARVLVDLTANIEYVEPTTRSTGTRVSKPKGYVSLAGCYDGQWFSQDMLTCTDEERRVLKPKFVTLLNARSDKNASRKEIPGFNYVCSHIIKRLYGEEGCAVLSSTQIEKLAKSGVVSLEDFLLAEIGKLLKDKAVKAYLGMTASRVKAAVKSDRSNVDDAIEMVWMNAALFEHFKLCPELSQDKRDLITVWEHLRRNRRFNAAVDALKEVERELPLNKRALKLGMSINASPWIPYLDLKDMQAGIVDTDPNVKDEAIKLFIKACKG